MRPRTKERLPVPTDEEIQTYDNVPVDVAARYLDWTEKNVRLALREGRAPFRVAIKDKSLTYKVAPGGLVRYKREGVPVISYETLMAMIKEVVTEVVVSQIQTLRQEFIN